MEWSSHLSNAGNVELFNPDSIGQLIITIPILETFSLTIIGSAN